MADACVSVRVGHCGMSYYAHRVYSEVDKEFMKLSISLTVCLSVCLSDLLYVCVLDWADLLLVTFTASLDSCMLWTLKAGSLSLSADSVVANTRG